MRRTLPSGLALAALLPLLSSLPARAEAILAPETAASVWSVDGTGSGDLDGIGAWMYVANAPDAPWDYSVQFAFSGTNQVGAVGVGTEPATLQHFAGLATGGGPTMQLPFNWQAGRFYYVLTYRLDTDIWGGWVYDHTAESWTFIGQTTAVAGSGLLKTTDFTPVEWDGPIAATCAGYPATEAYVYNPLGYRGASFTISTLLEHTSPDGSGCPSSAATDFGWSHYRAGV